MESLGCTWNRLAPVIRHTGQEPRDPARGARCCWFSSHPLRRSRIWEPPGFAFLVPFHNAAKETSFAPSAADRPGGASVENLAGEASRRPAELREGWRTWSQRVGDLGLSAAESCDEGSAR